jgi:hypothetical protein
VTEEEFERWKHENGWYSTPADAALAFAAVLALALIVWLS